MSATRGKRVRDQEISDKFEKQQRRLNRRWMRNAVSGIVLVVVVFVVLQFTPYRNIHHDIVRAAKDFVKSLTSGKSVPVEPDPKYW